MPMADRWYSTRRHISGNTTRNSLILDTASMREWSFPDAPLRGVYGRNDVYERIESWEDFDQWLSRIERFSARQLHSIADEIPCEWYGERAELQRLLDCLLERRRKVRQLIEDFRTSSRNPLPNWAMERPAPCSTEASREPVAASRAQAEKQIPPPPLCSASE
jgi:hypothetical protein